MHRGASDEAAQDVATPLVRGLDPVGDEERRRTPVLDDDPHGAVGRLISSVALARERLNLLDVRQEQIGLEAVGDHTLKNQREPLEADAGVDVLLWERGQGAVGLAVVLLEDEIPDLDPSSAVLRRRAVVLAHTGLRTAIDEHLAAGSAQPGRSRRPEVRLVALLEVSQAVDLLRRKEPQLLRPDVATSFAGSKPNRSVRSSQPQLIASFFQ